MSDQPLIAAVLKLRRSWPPSFPRSGTLLTPSNDTQLPREEWGVEEWRQYALFLEESGQALTDELRRRERPKPVVQLPRRFKEALDDHFRQGGTLLTFKRKRPGPKPDPKNKTLEAATAVIKIASENGLSDREALEEYYSSLRKRKHRAKWCYVPE